MSHPKESIILGRLLQRQDPTYRDFHKKLLPTVDPERLIGVRTPQLRSLAKELSGTPEAEDFLASLPHTYYDENTLHGLLISNGKDISWVIAQLDRFLPFVDNWATCDLTRPKIFQKHLPELLPKVKEWLASDHEYTVRFGIGMLLSFYLDRAFQPEYLTWVASLHRQGILCQHDDCLGTLQPLWPNSMRQHFPICSPLLGAMDSQQGHTKSSGEHSNSPRTQRDTENLETETREGVIVMTTREEAIHACLIDSSVYPDTHSTMQTGP